MFRNLFLLMTLSLSGADEPWSTKVVPTDPMSYIEVAEEISSKKDLTIEQERLVKELYVLAAVLDPSYRDSAILGILTVERDKELRMRLQNLRAPMPTLVESVVYNQNTLSVISAEARDQLLTSLVLLRKGRRLSAESVRLLTEWGVFSPNKYALDIGDHEVARKELTSTEIHTTLRIELDVLGGSSLWSADYASTEGSPVVVSMTKNLAILLAVDPNKTIRRDGLWVEK